MNSRENQAVKKIDQAENLDDGEKDGLLAAHQNGLADIDRLMEADRKRQEADMDAMLRARLDRKRKRA